MFYLKITSGKETKHMTAYHFSAAIVSRLSDLLLLKAQITKIYLKLWSQMFW
jgi:hypothetical protein